MLTGVSTRPGKHSTLCVEVASSRFFSEGRVHVNFLCAHPRLRAKERARKISRSRYDPAAPIVVRAVVAGFQLGYTSAQRQILLGWYSGSRPKSRLAGTGKPGLHKMAYVGRGCLACKIRSYVHQDNAI